MRWHQLSTLDVGVGRRRVWRLLFVIMLLKVTACNVCLVDAGYERACSLDDLIGQRAGVCGSRLVDLLRVVCRSVYNKRSTDYAIRRRERLRGMLAAIQSKTVRPDNARSRGWTATAFGATTTTSAAAVSDAASGVDVGPFISRDEAMSFTSTRHRGRRSILRQGIVCECCVHRCKLAELQGYCGSSPSN